MRKTLLLVIYLIAYSIHAQSQETDFHTYVVKQSRSCVGFSMQIPARCSLYNEMAGTFDEDINFVYWESCRR